LAIFKWVKKNGKKTKSNLKKWRSKKEDQKNNKEESYKEGDLKDLRKQKVFIICL
jgi:hypothetical protein